jgi:hypothetical protein
MPILADAPRVDCVKPNDIFWKIVATATKRTVADLKAEFKNRRILGLDPGETTGVCRFEATEVEYEGIYSCDYTFALSQLETKEIGQSYEDLEDLVEGFKPDHIRAEEYRVYGWMADQHSWAVLHTPQWIGAIKVLAHLHSIPISFKLAQQAKAFWNDDNLKACGLYIKGQKHARDALRHTLFYLTFPDKED